MASLTQENTNLQAKITEKDKEIEDQKINFENAK